MPLSPHAVRHVRFLRGELTQHNFDRVAEVAIDECDYVLGLGLAINPSSDDNSEFSVGVHEDKQLVVCKADEMGGIELVIDGGFFWLHGAWQVDGFYLVKPGGTHQGVSSFGLTPTDEAAIRLNPAIKIITIGI